MERIVAIALLLALAGTAAAMAVGRFSAGDLTGWQEQTFRGKRKTTYSLVKDGELTVLKAESRGSASGLTRKMSFDPKTQPWLRWSWKIAGTLKKGNEGAKEGDDYAARVYVIFPGTFFWQTRAINYIWANRLPKGASTPNPFAPRNVMMVAVESGDSGAGKWLSEERNVYEDYMRLFGEEPPRAEGVALMTDSDNTGSEATAWYGDITLAHQ
ncbi:DUF3047 domain-containing protein [Geobacter sulfurreducens]|uniref:DUF3047 domain-containing protein n=1 Tax=Geobacter sulfurreducens TaxID=35554 RepID=UPI000DBB9CBC|nr:DUF3047 domain-containing protein [Geobacter sulfurreducens]BBA69695.1 hypothetical protein YM18_1153 [Geobacter sulfurreducens]